MPTANPTDWTAFYAEIDKATPIPVQRLANYAPITTVADTIVVLDDVLTKAHAMPSPPQLISVYADVLKINGTVTPSIAIGGLVLCARRIEVASGAQIKMDGTGAKGQLVIFATEVGGDLTVLVSTTPAGAAAISQSFSLTDRSSFGSVIAVVNNVPSLLTQDDFEDSGLDYGDPLRINAVTIMQYGLAAFYSHPDIAQSMFNYVLRVTRGSDEATDLYMQATAATANLLANASPSSYVPYLDMSVYKQSMDAFVTAASAFEDQYNRFTDLKSSAQDRKAAADLMLAQNQDSLSMNLQLIDQTSRNLADANSAAQVAAMAVQRAQIDAKIAGIAFKYDVGTWTRHETTAAVFSICMSLVEFGGAIAGMCAGDPEGGAAAGKAVEGGAKAAEGVKDIAQTTGAAAGEAKKVVDISEQMKKIADVVEKLAKMYEALQKIIELSNTIADAQSLPDGSLPDSGDITTDPGWDVFLLDVTSLLQPAIDAKVDGAQDYLDAVTKLSLYAKAYMAAQVAVVNVAQQLVQLQLQKAANAAQVARLTQFIATIETQEANLDEIRQAFFQWELNMRFWVFIAFQNYAWAFRYWALRDSHTTPSIVKTVTQLRADLATVQSEREAGLAAFNPAPQPFHTFLTIQAGDAGIYAGVVNNLKSQRQTTVPIKLTEAAFATLGRVRLNMVRAWLVGIDASVAEVNLVISNSGFYEDRLLGKTYQFTTQPLTRRFAYNGAIADSATIVTDPVVADDFRGLYFQPTPFTQWTISAALADSPSLDLSKLTAIKFEFSGTTNPA